MNNMITKPLFQYALELIRDFRKAVEKGNDIKAEKIERKITDLCGIFQVTANMKAITKIMSSEPGTKLQWRYIERNAAKEIAEMAEIAEKE